MGSVNVVTGEILSGELVECARVPLFMMALMQTLHCKVLDRKHTCYIDL